MRSATIQKPIMVAQTVSITLDVGKHLRYTAGREDRLEGRPCLSANGAYLEGWYSPDREFYFVTKAEWGLYLLNPA